MQNGAQKPEGSLFDIQRYSVHDGPGIRTLLFTKGCPLRCRWCSNPEGLDTRVDIFSEPNKCIGCGRCLAACHFDAISFDPQYGFSIDRDKCVRCGDCAEACPSESKTLVGKTMSVDEAVKIAKREAAFYKSSGGGITMGGGEILMQPEFVYAVLKKCREEGLNTAIETSALGSWDWLEKIISVTDTIHIDLKAADPLRHRTITGADNGVILENILRTDEALGKAVFQGKTFIIRMPIIPGMNDSEDDIQKAVLFLSKLRNCAWIELLPFHNFGERKYLKLNMDYAFTGAPNSTEEMLEPLRDKLAAANIPIKIGKI